MLVAGGGGEGRAGGGDAAVWGSELQKTTEALTSELLYLPLKTPDRGANRRAPLSNVSSFMPRHSVLVN